MDGVFAGRIMAALAVLSVATSGHAGGFTVIPSLSVGAMYDDNLFFNSARIYGAGLRAAPSLSVEYQPTAQFSLFARGGLDSEYFGDPEVDSGAARRNASVNASYRFGPRTTASAAADYAFSAYASELLPAVGIEYGRRTAESFGGRLELAQRISRQITLRAGYGVQSYQLERSGRGVRSQLTPDVNVAFQLAPRTTLNLQAGPRFFAGAVSGFGSATLERIVPRGRVSLAYARGRSLAFDRTMLVESYTARVSFKLSPALSVTASPSLFRQWEHAAEHRTWHLQEVASYRANSWMSLFVGHAYVLEDRDPLRVFPGVNQLERNTLSAGVTLMPRQATEAPKR
jgi:hypothetical protein